MPNLPNDLTPWIIVAIIILFVFWLLSSSLKITQEYERAVVFRLGRLAGVRGPGVIFLIPILDRIQRLDLRTVTLDVPAQEVITRDNVTIRVNAVLYFRVFDPALAVVNVLNFMQATLQIAQTTLRSVLGQSELDELLAHRERINQQLQFIIDQQTEPWGIKVSVVEVKDLELPQSMQRAMAKQAEAEREKRAKIIHAEGEFQASQQLSAAAEIIGRESATLQLRYLQTLTEIASERNSTIIFPIPIEFLSLIMNGAGQPSSNGSTPRNTANPAELTGPALATRLTGAAAGVNPPPPIAPTANTSEQPLAEPFRSPNPPPLTPPGIPPQYPPQGGSGNQGS
ncbi:MAG: hypothetical protein DLM69_03655 [Candidatus Chloroheliales bacterium]|nr:MAG: hypothetical protein DLM69_03655 [Chloroflexota bacterium]